MMHDLRALMVQIELFRGLTEAQIDKLVAISQREVYPANATILNHNMPGDNLYIIVSGEVAVLKRGAAGQFYPALYLGEGQIFGEVALLDQGTRSAAITAVQADTVVYALGRQAFDALCQSDLALGFHVMRNLALDLAFKLRHRNYDMSGDV
ncbi:MAG: cyclic nucleotide-binding domain-containing protein [Chloroflexi bacterium]|nr:cyclic nucleotide-binding domain-containing protein [Chloroflexota bacterium]